MFMLSSNLSYNLPEWIMWLLNKQTAVGQCFSEENKTKFAQKEKKYLLGVGKF